MTKTRVLAALIMAPVAIAAILLLPTQWLAAAAAAVLLIGLWEWLKLADVEDTLARTVLLVLNLVLMVLLVWMRFFNFGAQPGSPARILKLLAGTLAIVPAWAALVLIHAGGDPPGHQGHLWLLAALALVWAADSGAYFAGRHFGKHKLAPRISPNKTWEGLVGGLIAGVAVAVGLGWLAGIDAAHLPGLLVTSVVAVFASVLGDLFESLIKRHAGAKDSGHLIPGHGGVLDRVDGVLAAIPVFALGKEIFGF